MNNMENTTDNDVKFVIEGGLKDTNIVQKTKPFAELWHSEFTLTELKIIDVYLSRINSHKPEQRMVVFEKGELEKLFELKNIRPNVLKKCMLNLVKTTMQIEEVVKNKPRTTIISIFSRASCEKGDDGLWYVELSCTDEAMKYIFQIEQIGYLKYQLRNITKISSRYSYFMYLLLENYRANRVINEPKTFKISVDDLKLRLNCLDESYDNFKEFNRYVLKNCQAEINEKTDLKYSYSLVRQGHKVAEIEFMIYPREVKTIEAKTTAAKTQNEAIVDEEIDNRSEAEIMTENFRLDEEHYINDLRKACDNEFTYKQIQLLYELICSFDTPPVDDLSVYLRQQYLQLNVAAESKVIKNRFAYLKGIIQNDKEQYAY